MIWALAPAALEQTLPLQQTSLPESAARSQTSAAWRHSATVLSRIAA